MNKIDQLLEDYKYLKNMSLSALEAGKKATYVYASNELANIQRKLHNEGINLNQIKRLVG